MVKRTKDEKVEHSKDGLLNPEEPIDVPPDDPEWPDLDAYLATLPSYRNHAIDERAAAVSKFLHDYLDDLELVKRAEVEAGRLRSLCAEDAERCKDEILCLLNQTRTSKFYVNLPRLKDERQNHASRSASDFICRYLNNLLLGCAVKLHPYVSGAPLFSRKEVGPGPEDVGWYIREPYSSYYRDPFGLVHMDKRSSATVVSDLLREIHDALQKAPRMVLDMPPLEPVGVRSDDRKLQEKKRGRPVKSDPREDTRLAKLWNSGDYRTYEECATAASVNGKHYTRQDIERALQRHRARDRRKD